MASPALNVSPLHAARLALLHAALSSLLLAAADDEEPNDIPDGVAVTFDGTSVDIEYTRGGIPVAGESL